jgi:ABC-2 type transport system ATP-binding protein
LLCTHNLAEAEELADKVAIIHQGRILLNDSVDQVKRSILGPEEYEAHLAGKLNGWVPILPNGVELKAQGETWLRFRIKDPQVVIPLLLRQLLDQQLSVVSFQEVPRSLEQAFLQAVGRPQGVNHEP